MKKTMKERVISRLLYFGKKNKFCRYLVLPVMVVCMLFFHVLMYIRGNGKRFAVLAMIFCLFTVYSSFSFPIFVLAETEGQAVADIGMAGDGVSLVQEAPLGMLGPGLLDEEEDDFEYSGEEAHGYSGMDVYNAEEILLYKETVDGGRPSVSGGDVSAKEEEITFARDDWRLVLVNKQHSIPEDYEFNLGTITGNLQCDERIIDDLLAMIQAAKEEGINLQISSPYRTEARQEYLLNRKITRYMNRGMSFMEAYQLASRTVQLPGNSEHQIGLALDIVCDTYINLDKGFENTEAGKWLAANSYKYGFILRYPKDKEYYTGIEYEPWHFRYVGEEAATVITERGITLEEFWEEL